MSKSLTTPTPFDLTSIPPSFLENAGFVINRVAGQLNRQIEAVIAPLDLNIAQFGLMILLELEGPQAQIMLSRRVGLDRTSIMRSVDLLEARGLVQRHPDPVDRRKHSVALTDAGTALLARTLPKVRAAERKYASVLSEREHKQLMGLLTRLLQTDQSA